MKIAAWLFFAVLIFYFVYQGFKAARDYYDLNEAVEKIVVGPTLVRPGLPAFTGDDRAEKMKIAILKEAAALGISLDDRKVSVSAEERMIRVTWARLVIWLPGGEPVLVIPLWLERSFQ